MPTPGLNPVARRVLALVPPTRDLAPFLEDRLGFLTARAASDGLPPRLRLGWPTYLVRDPEDVEHILIVNHRAYDKTRRLTGRRGRRLVGDALLTRRGEVHRRRRHVLQPLFHRGAVAEIVAPAAENAAAEVAGWPVDEPFDASERIHGLVLRSRLRTVFSDARDDELERLAAAVVARHRFLLHLFAALHPLPELFPLELARGYRWSLRVLEAAIERRRVRGEHDSDLISMLLKAREDGRPLSARELRDEVMTIALTGYESTASLMVWLLHVLAKHPSVQSRARAEVDAVLAGRAVKIEDLPELPFVRSVLAETLRLFPPTWIMPRVATRPDRLPSGLVVRAHTKLYLCPWVVHRDPRYHPDPERFDPDRFAGEWRKRFRWGTYFPFGAGPHVCIGERIATTEAMLFLATVLSHWHVERAGDGVVIPEPGQALKACDGLVVCLRARRSRPALSA